MASPGKDTLYIEAEDEITAVIEKVVNAKNKIVAVVLPKHATVFQSQVNLKLLKKAAVSAKKNLVLITSDSSILAIAGVAGVHVAKTPTSKPIIPAFIAAATTDEVSLDEFSGTQGSLTKSTQDDEAIELDNTDRVVEPEKALDEKKKKMLKIPDFSSFRIRLTLGMVTLITLIALWFVGFVVMPKATITVKTDVSTNSVDTKITAKVGTAELDVANNVIPATKVQIEKIDSVTVPATGEKNVGTKATGTMTLTNCINDGEKKIIPAGTIFSSGSNSFLTAEAITLKAAYFNDGACLSADFPILGAQGTVDVAAADAGESFNLSARAYNSSISGIQAYGSDMTGGTSQIIKVVSAEDVEKAAQELSGTSKNQAITELQKQLRDSNKRPIDETVTTGKATVVASPAVGAETKDTKVTMTVTYGLLGVVESDLSQILDAQIKKNLKDQPINIRDNGLSSIAFSLSEAPNDADTVLTMQTIATIGPDINPTQIKESSAGKKRGDIEKQVESIDGVKSVSVEYSPFWVTTTPKNAEKITIVFVEENDN
jgi:hypothetical protein